MKKIFAGLTAAVLALTLSAPGVLADTKVAVCSNVGNGARSRNFVFCMIGKHGHGDHDDEPDIKQKNIFVGGPTVVVIGQNTGYNTVKNNTGGSSGVISGNARARVEIHTVANSNVVNP